MKTPATVNPTSSEQDKPSQVTILNTRASNEQSDVAELIDMENFGYLWSSRAEFIFASLCFCLNLGNLWRLPKQTLQYGEGSFLLIYVISSILFGIPILFFETVLGQYTKHGVIKVFNLVPICQGATYAMVFYSNLITHIFNVTIIYNFIYMITSIRASAPLPSMEKVEYKKYCFFENRSSSMANDYFLNEIVMVSEDFNCDFNIRNVCILFIFWLNIWVYTANEYSTRKKFSMCLYFIIIMSLLITFISGMFINGSLKGLKRLFSLKIDAFLDYQTYIFAFEQTFITLGVGMGALINFGSRTKFRSPLHTDCIIINVCTIIASILMVFIVFEGVGVHFKETNEFPRVLTGQEFNIHVLLTKLFFPHPMIWKFVVIFLFYFAFSCVGFYNAIKYAELLVYFAMKKFDINPKYTTRITLLYCVVQFGIGCATHTRFVHEILNSASNVFMVLSVLTITSVEVFGFCYLYGLKNFTEDIEFMLGIMPNIFYRIIWMSLPWGCLVVLTSALYLIFTKDLDKHDAFFLALYFGAIVLPILIIAILIGFKAAKKKQFSIMATPIDYADYWNESASTYR